MENKRGYITLGETGVSLRMGSTSHKVYLFLHQNPGYFSPKDLARETGKSHSSVKKAVLFLARNSLIDRPRHARGLYRGKIDHRNLYLYEKPEILFHNIKIKIEVPQKGVPHPPLYTRGMEPMLQKNGSKPEDRVLWLDLEGLVLKVTLQLFSSCVLVHTKASKTPLCQKSLRLYKERLLGVLEGMGICTAFGLRIVYLEMNKDYEKITITPRMISIDELLEKDNVTLYNKTRNLARLEFRGSFSTEKELWKLFRDFGGHDLNQLDGYQ